MFTQTTRKATEKVELKWIDTSSKFGHGAYQTPAEKKQFIGTVKKDLVHDHGAAPAAGASTTAAAKDAKTTTSSSTASKSKTASHKSK